MKHYPSSSTSRYSYHPSSALHIEVVVLVVVQLVFLLLFFTTISIELKFVSSFMIIQQPTSTLQNIVLVERRRSNSYCTRNSCPLSLLHQQFKRQRQHSLLTVSSSTTTTTAAAAAAASTAMSNNPDSVSTTCTRQQDEAMNEKFNTKKENIVVVERIHSIKSPFLTSFKEENSKKKLDEYENVMIILNSPIELFSNPTISSIASSTSSISSTVSNKSSTYAFNPIFDRLWNISTYRVCADGGANRLYDAASMCTSAITTPTPTANGATTNTNAYSTPDNNNNNDNHNHHHNYNKYIPDLIKGDLDSVHDDIKAYYKSKGCSIIQDFDQDTNDLDKALEAVREWWLSKKSSSLSTKNNDVDHRDNDKDNNVKGIQIYIYGAFGGRFDQEMASIQALYKWSSIFDYRIFLYNHETCSWLLKPMHLDSSSGTSTSSNSENIDGVIDDGVGTTTIVRNDIQIPFYGEDDGDDDNNNHNGLKNSNKRLIVGEGPTCGLIPIACKSDSVKTGGLKWNLDGSSNSTLEFGGLVSSSNRVMDDVVSVYTSAPLIFTAEIVYRNAKD